MLTPTEFHNELVRRYDAGISQAAMAAQFCVTQQAVQQWLSRATSPSKMVLRMAGRVWGDQVQRNVPLNLTQEGKLP